MVFEQITAVPARPIFAVIHSIFSSDTNISAFNMQKIFANFSAGMFILHIKDRAGRIQIYPYFVSTAGNVSSEAIPGIPRL